MGAAPDCNGADTIVFAPWLILPVRRPLASGQDAAPFSLTVRGVAVKMIEGRWLGRLWFDLPEARC